MFLPLGKGGRGAGIYRTEVDVFTVVVVDDDDDEGLLCVDVPVTDASPLPLPCSEVFAFGVSGTRSTSWEDIRNVKNTRNQSWTQVKNSIQGFFICHIINDTGYNQKWNVIKSGPLSGQCKRIKNKNYIKVTQHNSI